MHLEEPGRRSPDDHVAAVAKKVAGLHPRPALIVVQGDTSTALGAALGAQAAGVPLAHVEAGLRTHDLAQPWPEEGYRRRIDALADLLFAPTELAAEHLINEKLSGAIHVTGNSGVDALLGIVGALPQKPMRDSREFRILVTCHRRENWSSGIANVAAALTELAGDGSIRVDLVQHSNAELARRVGRLLGHVEGVHLHPACDYPELIARVRDCDLLLSDSGGLQEEAPALGIPLLVLRDKTERPEGLDTGNMRLVGCRSSAIIAAVRELQANPTALAAMRRPAFPYGDGKAAERIAAIIEDWFSLRTGSQRRTA